MARDESKWTSSVGGALALGGLLVAAARAGENESDDGGNGDGGSGISSTFNGTPKADYYYCGDQRDLFNQWQALEITTTQFSSMTAQGQGTNQLQLSPCSDPNQAPSVTIESYSVNNGILSVSASGTDPDGRITDYNWTLKKAGTVVAQASGQEAGLLLDGYGNYTLQVTATDDAGDTAMDSHSFSYEDPAPDGPQVIDRQINAGKTAEISVFRTEALDARHGTVPEDVMANMLADAIEYMGFNVRVTYGFDPQPAATEASGCQSDGQWGSGAWSWWTYWGEEQDNIPDAGQAKDCRLLLVDEHGGGCGTGGGGTYSIAGARGLDSYIEWDETLLYKTESGNPRSDVGSIFAAMHEVGHNFDQGHGTQVVNNIDAARVSEFGPNFATDTTTDCGVYSPARRDDYEWQFMPYWGSDCAMTKFENAIK